MRRAALLLGVAGALAAPATVDAGVTSVRVAQREFRFTLNRTAVAPGTIEFKVRNRGQDGHNLVVRSRSGRKVLAELPVVLVGDTASLRVRLRRVGYYPLVCTIDDHLARGMRTRLRVRRRSRLRRGPGERLAAWVYTGPLGHLWSTAADLGSFFARSLASRVQRRLPGSGRRSSARR